MITQKQLSYASLDLAGREQTIAEVLKLSGPITRNRITALCHLTLSSVCGGVGSMLDKGAVFVTEADGGQLVTYDRNVSAWADRAADRTKQRQLDRIKDFAADFAPYLDATTVEGLRRAYLKARLNTL